MTESEESAQQQPPSPSPSPSVEELSNKLEKLDVPSSFNIWPPTLRTRDAVINRLIDTLSQPSILSMRYGTLPPEEASATAHAIEEQAFDVASAAAGLGDVASLDYGIEILQVYSKDISKRMLDAVKSRSVAANPELPSVQSTAKDATAASETEEVSERESSIENESS